jgi:PAS domain S-box-containing protein
MPASKARVLVVTENVPDARLLESELAAIGSEPLAVTIARNPDEARARLCSSSFDIALVDCEGAGEPDAVARLRGQAPHVPIVCWTGSRQGPPQALARAIRGALRQKRTEDALRLGEELLRLACQASRAMVYAIDTETGRALFVHGLAPLLGCGPEDGPQTREWYCAQIHKDDITKFLHDWRQARDQGRDYCLRYRIRHGSGAYIVVEDSGRNILDAAGRAVRTVGSAVDITERAQAEERYEELLRQRTSDLEWRSRQLRTLASELTHAEERERKRLAQAIHDDLQQLLAGAKFCLEMLGRDLGQNHQESVQQLGQFLKDAIESTRSLAFDLSPPILHMAGLAQSLDYLGRQMEAKHGLKVHVRADSEAEPEAENLKILLFQAVRELLFNVVKHAQVKEAEIEMRRFKEDSVQITVSDSGVGFDPGKCAREDASGGFGLFSIRGRLDLMGGAMEIASAPGSGTRCTIVAPSGRAAPEEAPIRGKPRTGLLRAGRKIRVLVADDHTLMRQGLTRLLQGHKDIAVVGEAADGVETLELARRLDPDVIVMQVDMPGLDGIETTARLTEEFPEIKVIGLCAGEELQKATAMRKAGACAFVNKTNRLDALVAAIRESGAA